MNTLTLLTTAHIQSYIFHRTNRLRESVGASLLVQDVFAEFKDRPEEIFIGGGQAALLFSGPDSQSAAKRATEKWSLNVLKQAPGLRVVAIHEPCPEGTLQQTFRHVRDQHRLELAENALPFGSSLGALPIAKTCPSTGLAANCFYKPSEKEDGQWLNVEAVKKREAEFERRDHRFPRDLAEMGLQKGDSMIAVIHADGDGVGHELKKVVSRDYPGDEDFIKELKAFSGALTKLTKDAQEALYTDLKELLPDLRLNKLVEGKAFPLRPVIGSGDDVTFICPAKLGLPLAARYVELFTQLSRKAVTDYKSERKELSASAGVLLMPQKFPFSRGYKLASEITAQAKRARRKARDQGPWLDFHVLHEGITGSLENIRKFYRVDGDKELLTRPYSLTNFNTKFHERWKTLDCWPRSAAKELLEAFSRGKEAASAQIDYFRSRERELPYPLFPRDGWEGDITPVFDPLEFLDHYFPINWKTHRLIQRQPRGNTLDERAEREGRYANV